MVTSSMISASNVETTAAAAAVSAVETPAVKKKKKRTERKRIKTDTLFFGCYKLMFALGLYMTLLRLYHTFLLLLGVLS